MDLIFHTELICGWEFLLFIKEKKPTVRRGEEFCRAINQSLFKSRRAYFRHIITSDPIFKMSSVMRLSVRDEVSIKAEMTASLLLAFFTSFILMSALQTTFPDRLSFWLILLEADKPQLLILRTT